MKEFNELHIINCNDTNRAAGHILGKWRKGDGAVIVNFLYYSNFITLHKDKRYLEAMKLSDYILIDGIGMQLYFKMVKRIWPFNLNGTDLSPVLLKSLDKDQIPIALYGTTEENIVLAEQNITAYLDNQSIYFRQNGFTPLDWEAVREGSALLIGMGSPRQENWVADHIDMIRQKRLLVITVGGFFDFASGFYTRAPKIIRKLKLEWAWRTMLHPGRHLKKRLNDLTILYKPLLDRLRREGKYINVSDI